LNSAGKIEDEDENDDEDERQSVVEFEGGFSNTRRIRTRGARLQRSQSVSSGAKTRLGR
jgi:hypothetical protein